MESVISSSLRAFATLASQYESSSDPLVSLLKLFAPITNAHVDEIFDPQKLSKSLENFYGLKMHPWALVELAGRLEKAGLLEQDTQTNASAPVYRYQKIDLVGAPGQQGAIDHALEAFREHFKAEAPERLLKLADEEIDQRFLTRLVSQDVLKFFSQADFGGEGVTTDVVNKKVSEVGSGDRDFDVFFASYLLKLRACNPELLQEISLVTQGALIAEVIVNFQKPAKKATLAGLTVYLDGPILLSVLGIADRRECEYSHELLLQLREAKANLATFTHCVDEAAEVASAFISSLSNGSTRFGALSRRKATDHTFVAHVQTILLRFEQAIRDSGIAISKAPVDSALTYFSADEEDDLARNIGYYDNNRAQLRDAKSLAYIVRMRGGHLARSGDVSSAKRIFLTKNDRLANCSEQHLIRKGAVGIRDQGPALTERSLAGLLWITLGGAAKELPLRRLLSNCMQAVMPSAGLIRKVHSFLNDLDVGKASNFEALMTNDRVAMMFGAKYSLRGDAISATDVGAMYDEVERMAADKIVREKEKELQTMRAAIEAEKMDLERKLEQAVSVEAATADQAKQIAQQKQAAELQAVGLRKGIEDLSERLRETDRALSDERVATAEKTSRLEALEAEVKASKIAGSQTLALGWTLIAALGYAVISVVVVGAVLLVIRRLEVSQIMANQAWVFYVFAIAGTLYLTSILVGIHLKRFGKGIDAGIRVGAESWLALLKRWSGIPTALTFAYHVIVVLAAHYFVTTIGH